MKILFKTWIYPILLVVFLFNPGCRKDKSSGDSTSYKIYTTLDRTIVPASVPSTSPMIFPYELSKYSLLGYGVWQFGPELLAKKDWILCHPVMLLHRLLIQQIFCISLA